jgi:single-strand DNA-binding protein
MSINKVLLIGNLGADPEMRSTANGDAICNLRLATNESWKDRHTGEQRESTEWHTVVLYRKLAEIAERYLKKGARIYIEGRVRYRKWQDKNGIERTSTEIEASSMTMLDSRGGSASQVTEVRGPSTLRGEPPVSFGSSGREPAFPDDGIPF